jgi:hypothetical protein
MPLKKGDEPTNGMLKLVKVTDREPRIDSWSVVHLTLLKYERKLSRDYATL